jgi:hypothetical protein
MAAYGYPAIGVGTDGTAAFGLVDTGDNYSLAIPYCSLVDGLKRKSPVAHATGLVHNKLIIS